MKGLGRYNDSYLTHWQLNNQQKLLSNSRELGALNPTE
ncbi:Uncharacterised protein [Moellerella wisconsensis]|nr:Uncharacterised protein [Moellerella wisconsensis]